MNGRRRFGRSCNGPCRSLPSRFTGNGLARPILLANMKWRKFFYLDQRNSPLLQGKLEGKLAQLLVTGNNGNSRQGAIESGSQLDAVQYNSNIIVVCSVMKGRGVVVGGCRCLRNRGALMKANVAVCLREIRKK